MACWWGLYNSLVCMDLLYGVCSCFSVYGSALGKCLSHGKPSSARANHGCHWEDQNMLAWQTFSPNEWTMAVIGKAYTVALMCMNLLGGIFCTSISTFYYHPRTAVLITFVKSEISGFSSGGGELKLLNTAVKSVNQF